MFWKTKPQQILAPLPSPATAKPKSDSETLRDAAAILSDALNTYSAASYKSAKPQADPELDAAYDKVSATENMIKEGRLAYALGRCIPEHIQYWPSWSQMGDFEKHVGFRASEIIASKSEEEDGWRKVKAVTVDFNFNASRYRVILRDKGMSAAPDDPYRFGEIELFQGEKCVAIFGLIEDISRDYSQWEFSNVSSFKVGPWMQDMLDIAAQIDVSREIARDSFLDERVRRAAREIDLG